MIDEWRKVEVGQVKCVMGVGRSGEELGGLVGPLASLLV